MLDRVLNTPLHAISILLLWLDCFSQNLYQDQPSSARPFESIRRRLKSKEERLLGNLMGEPLNFSARSVISPDPYLDIDQVGIPRTIAVDLTYSETVNSSNINRYTFFTYAFGIKNVL